MGLITSPTQKRLLCPMSFDCAHIPPMSFEGTEFALSGERGLVSFAVEASVREVS